MSYVRNYCSANRSQANRSLGWTWIGLLAVMLGTALLSAAGCTTQSPPESVKLYVVVNKQPGDNKLVLTGVMPGAVKFDADQDKWTADDSATQFGYHVTLPPSARGQTLELTAKVLDKDKCRTGSGSMSLLLDEDGTVQVKVERPPAVCDIIVSINYPGSFESANLTARIDAAPSDCQVKPGEKTKNCSVLKGALVYLTPKVPANLRLRRWSEPCVGLTDCVFTCTQAARPVEMTVVADTRCKNTEYCPEVPFGGIRGVWGSQSNDYWTVGVHQQILHVIDGKLSSATVAVPASDATLQAIAGKTSSDIWAVGEGGLLVHYDGTSWGVNNDTIAATKLLDMNNLRKYPLYGVAVANDPADQRVWVVGAHGIVLERSAPEVWKLTQLGSGDLHGVWARSEGSLNLAVVVGDGGSIHYFRKGTDTTWQDLSLPVDMFSSNLHSVTGIFDQMGHFQLWAVASFRPTDTVRRNNVVRLSYDGKDLLGSSVEGWGTKDLYAVWSMWDSLTASAKVWAAGDGQILRFDGILLPPVDLEDQSLWSIWGSQSDAASVRVGGDLGVFRRTTVSPISDGADASWTPEVTNH